MTETFDALVLGQVETDRLMRRLYDRVDSLLEVRKNLLTAIRTMEETAERQRSTCTGVVTSVTKLDITKDVIGSIRTEKYPPASFFARSLLGGLMMSKDLIGQRVEFDIVLRNHNYYAERVRPITTSTD